jgi:hypothetical protein
MVCRFLGLAIILCLSNFLKAESNLLDVSTLIEQKENERWTRTWTSKERVFLPQIDPITELNKLERNMVLKETRKWLHSENLDQLGVTCVSEYWTMKNGKTCLILTMTAVGGGKNLILVLAQSSSNVREIVKSISVESKYCDPKAFLLALHGEDYLGWMNCGGGTGGLVEYSNLCPLRSKGTAGGISFETFAEYSVPNGFNLSILRIKDVGVDKPDLEFRYHIKYMGECLDKEMTDCEKPVFEKDLTLDTGFPAAKQQDLKTLEIEGHYADFDWVGMFESEQTVLISKISDGDIRVASWIYAVLDGMSTKKNGATRLAKLKCRIETLPEIGLWQKRLVDSERDSK